MKIKTLCSLLAVTAALLVLYPSAAIAVVQVFPLQASAPPKVSEAEATALSAINAAPDAAAKLTLAEEFVKKYPKSPAVPQLAENLAVEIAKVPDAAQKLALADRFQKAFGDDKAFAVIQSARL